MKPAKRPRAGRRRPWEPPSARRMALSAAEAGGDTSTDGIEILS